MYDREGLFLLVNPYGSKLWRWRYWADGKERLMALGEYPIVNLAEARERHFAARKKVAAGIDPIVERKAETESRKREAKARGVYLFAIFGWFCLKGWRQLLLFELAWRRRASGWHEPTLSISEGRATLARRVCSGLRALPESAARRIVTRSAATSANAALVEPPPLRGQGALTLASQPRLKSFSHPGNISYQNQ